MYDTRCMDGIDCFCELDGESQPLLLRSCLVGCPVVVVWGVLQASPRTEGAMVIM